MRLNPQSHYAICSGNICSQSDYEFIFELKTTCSLKSLRPWAVQEKYRQVYPYRTELRRSRRGIGLRPELERRYRELHAAAWDSVLARLHACNIRNYSIFVAELDGKKYLFSYFEYVGEDFAADMRAMADDPETRRWWEATEPCQIKLPGRAPGEVWSSLERVFYTA